MGQDAHVLTFPVNGGDTLNIVAFKTSALEWPDSQRLTRPATRKELLHDFRDFGEPLRRLLSLTGDELDVVSTLFSPASLIDTLTSTLVGHLRPWIQSSPYLPQRSDMHHWRCEPRYVASSWRGSGTLYRGQRGPGRAIGRQAGGFWRASRSRICNFRRRETAPGKLACAKQPSHWRLL
jgi:hypothetical protein